MNERTVKSERLWLVASPEELEQIEKWRGQQRPIPSRSEAVRQLVQLGLLAASGDEKAQTYDVGPARSKAKEEA
jgi:hypothetical protein